MPSRTPNNLILRENARSPSVFPHASAVIMRNNWNLTETKFVEDKADLMLIL